MKLVTHDTGLSDLKGKPLPLWQFNDERIATEDDGIAFFKIKEDEKTYEHKQPKKIEGESLTKLALGLAGNKVSDASINMDDNFSEY